MPSQHEVRWSQLKVGVIVLVSSVILVTMLFLMTSSSGLGILSKKLTVTTYFENAAGLKDGAAVNLQGVTIGTVKSVEVTNDPTRKLTPVKVTMKLDGKYQEMLRQDSKADLTTVGVLGDTVVNVNSQSAVGGPLRDGDELHTLETPNIQDVVKASQGTIEQLNVILAKMNAVVDNLQAGKGSVGQLINNPDLYNKATRTVEELNTLEANLNAGRGSVGKLLHDDTLYDRLNETALKLDQIGSALQNGKGSAGKLLNDDTLYTNLNMTLTKTNALLDDVQHGKGAAGMLVNDPVFAQKLRDTVDETHALMANVNAGKGTLGKLATDDQAYVNINRLLTESTTLVTTIRADPKKYLTIHLKIF
jgi:phospholipid/cholesterol/gamma-HCH transport system substrate-binding protein